jgi:hypothetical protein
MSPCTAWAGTGQPPKASLHNVLLCRALFGRYPARAFLLPWPLDIRECVASVGHDRTSRSVHIQQSRNPKAIPITKFDFAHFAPKITLSPGPRAPEPTGPRASSITTTAVPKATTDAFRSLLTPQSVTNFIKMNQTKKTQTEPLDVFEAPSPGRA